MWETFNRVGKRTQVPKLQGELSKGQPMNTRPQFPLRFRDEKQRDRLEEEARVAGVSLNEYILRKLEGLKLDISRRQVK